MNPWRIFLFSALGAASFAACGPDRRPDEPCDGPTFNLVVTAEAGPLPADTRINVRYGGNQDGEPFALGDQGIRQAVFCDQGVGGTASEPAATTTAGAAGAPSDAPSVHAVEALRCRLYTQGPARLDVSATGYQPVDDLPLSLDGKLRCNVPFEVVLMPEKPDVTK